MKNNENISPLKHFFVIGIGTFINLLLGLLTTPLITRMVDPIEYGQLSIFTMYSGIGLLVLCLGLDQALVRYYYDKEDINYKTSLLFRCVAFPLLISIVISCIIVFFSYYRIINFEFNTFIVILLCVYTIIQILYRFSMAIIRLEKNSKVYSKINILIKILYILFTLPFLYFCRKNNFLILVFATIMSTFICLVLSILYQKKNWNFFKKGKKYESISNRKLIKYAYPFIISMGITTIFQAIDKFSLNYFYTYYEVGIYSSTMSLVHIFAIIQTTFNTLWMPMAVEHYKKDPQNKDFYVKANNIITVIMYFFGLSLILVKDVFSLILGAKYREAALILPFLIFNPIMYTISETTVCGLAFKEKSKMQVVVAMGACISNVIGNLLLVPRYGCIGAAISTGLSYFVFYILRTLLSNKYYYINFEFKKFIVVTFISMIYAGYNTIFRFNAICLIGYIVCIVVIYLLYRRTINYIFVYIKKYILKKVGKGKNGFV